MLPPKLPTQEELRPWLDKLEHQSGSVVMIALEGFETQNFCQVTIGWFSAEERKALRAALLKCKEKREKAAK